MPDSDVMYVRVLISDVGDSMLQATGKAFFVGFKSSPTTLKLGLAVGVLEQHLNMKLGCECCEYS